MKVWWCGDGEYAEKDELEICQLHEGFGCGWMQLVPVREANDLQSSTPTVDS